MKTKLITAILAASIATGCTTSPKNIGAAYVSPLKYQNYTCDQLASEHAAIEQRVSSAYGHLKKESSKDKWATGVGIVLFWPALLFLAGNDHAKEAEYAQLKGNYEAVQQSMIQHNCVPAVGSSQPYTGTVNVPPPSAYEAIKVKKP